MTIFFDFDGTIIDVSHRWYKLHIDITRRYNLPHYSFKKYIDAKRKGIAEDVLMKKLSDNKQSINLYCKKRLKLIEKRDYLQNDKLVQGIIPVLNLWKKKGKMILITQRRSKKNLLWEVKRFFLRRYFDEIINTGGEDKEKILKTKFSKPELKNSIIVSDSFEDYLIAKKLFMKSIVVGYGCRSANYFRKKGMVNIVKKCKDLK